MRSLLPSIRIFVLLFFWSLPSAAQRWQPLGPDGGSVRSLTIHPAHPERVLLGTSAGRLYVSDDSGASWARLAQLGGAAEMVLDHIVFDPSDPDVIYIAAWNAQAPDSDGDIFRSRDGGKTWSVLAGIHGKSIRALALAPSDPGVLVAGALDGVFRSRDRGETWERISPENHPELRTVESIAIDPANPEVIYAGTWHLAWKTEDGGKNWHSIKRGVIDDSDVFSIVIDQVNPANVYISACSGIYRSDSGGELFQKIQGIPYSARRTRSLRMDPSDHRIVYAGTTEGLWKTTDGGVTWKRMTGTNVVINDVAIDPRQPSRVLLATDRGGVLASNDGGISFTASNRGFTHRQVAALLVDRSDSSLVLAGVLNDKEFGGAFVSRDTGRTWTQLSDGLEGRDVLVLRQAADRSVVAGTDRGIFMLRPNSSQWIAINNLSSRNETKAETTPASESKPPIMAVKMRQTNSRRARPQELSARVTGLEIGPDRWFATTNAGFMVSTDAGSSWLKLDLPGIPAVIAMASSGRMLVAAGRNAVAVSVNGGQSWLPTKPLSADLTVSAVAVESSGNLWLAAREGLFRSTDLGESWKRISSLRMGDLASIQFDETSQRLLVTSASSNSVFESSDNGRTWTQLNSGWPLRGVTSVRGRLLGLTSFDGVVLQPEANTAGNAYSLPR